MTGISEVGVIHEDVSETLERSPCERTCETCLYGPTANWRCDRCKSHEYWQPAETGRYMGNW
jgi:hypothetical protein